MKVSEMKKIIKKNGCYKLAGGTKHEAWYSPITKKKFRIPRHNSKELPKGTAESILKQSGLK